MLGARAAAAGESPGGPNAHSYLLRIVKAPTATGPLDHTPSINSEWNVRGAQVDAVVMQEPVCCMLQRVVVMSTDPDPEHVCSFVVGQWAGVADNNPI